MTIPDDLRLYYRAGTQDELAVVEVLRDNEYRLPERFEPTDVIVDVGAHIGTFALACLLRGARNVLCFEPNPQCVDLLRKNVAAWPEAVSIMQAGVWSEACKRNLRIPDNEVATAMCDTLGRGLFPVELVGINCVLSTLPRIRLLKLDCEGAEKPILDAVRSLDNVQEVVGELHYQLPVEGGEPPTDEWLRRRLGELGMTDVVIEPGHNPAFNSNFWAKRG